MKEQAVATVAATAVPPPPVNYATLEADVAVWTKEYLQYISERLGEEAGRDIQADLTANPWLGLLWYVQGRLRDDEETAQ